jgi:hypothetical protein
MTHKIQVYTSLGLIYGSGLGMGAGVVQMLRGLARKAHLGRKWRAVVKVSTRPLTDAVKLTYTRTGPSTWISFLQSSPTSVFYKRSSGPPVEVCTVWFGRHFSLTRPPKTLWVQLIPGKKKK